MCRSSSTTHPPTSGFESPYTVGGGSTSRGCLRTQLFFRAVGVTNPAMASGSKRRIAKAVGGIVTQVQAQSFHAADHLQEMNTILSNASVDCCERVERARTELKGINTDAVLENNKVVLNSALQAFFYSVLLDGKVLFGTLKKNSDFAIPKIVTLVCSFVVKVVIVLLIRKRDKTSQHFTLIFVLIAISVALSLTLMVLAHINWLTTSENFASQLFAYGLILQSAFDAQKRMEMLHAQTA